MNDELSEAEQDKLMKAMGVLRDALKTSGIAAMGLADAFAMSISANIERQAALKEKDRVLDRIAKARGKHGEDIEDVNGTTIVWKK